MDLDIIKFMYSFYQENKVVVLTSIITSIIRAGLDSIVVPRALANVFNSLTESDLQHGYKEFRDTLIMLILIWILMKIIYVTSNYCRKTIEPKITEYIINKLVFAVFQKYETVNELSDVSSLINKIHLIKTNLQDLFYLMFTVFIPKIIVLVISLINISLINEKIGAFISISIFLQALIIYNNYASCLNSSYEEIEYQDKMYEYLQDVFHNINIVQSTYNGYELEINQIGKMTDDVTIKENISISCVNTQQNQSFFMNLVVFVIILVIIYNFYTSQKITHKEVVTLILSVNGMFENIYDFSLYIPELFSRIGILNSNEEFIKELMIYMDKGDEQKIELKQNFIIFKNVNFKYKDHVILHDFSFTIPSNKIIGLFGSSGSGKSTFIKLIFGIEEPDEGEIYIGNVPVLKKNCKSLRRYINYMNQNSNTLFDKSIIENIMYGYPNVSRQYIIDLFEKFELYNIFKNLDLVNEKYSFLDKPAGKLGTNLSGGQKAIIHLVRLDLNHLSKVIILDEVTSSLDNASRNNIIEYIKYLNNKGKTIIIISHDTYLESIYDIRLQFSHENNPISV